MARLHGLLVFLSTVGFVLSKQGPPRISDKVNGFLRVRVGRRIKLICPVEGDPPLLSTWTKDKENIHSGWKRFHVLRQGLKIDDVQMEDSGHYICKVTNGFGTVTVNYTLTVEATKPKPPRPTPDPNYREPVMPPIKEYETISGKSPGTKPRFSQPGKMARREIPRPVGSSVRLKCVATGHPRPTIIWKKDGERLTDSQLGEGRRAKWTLKLRNLRSSDSGKYTCIVFNTVGSINATYTLDVIERFGPKSPDLIGEHPLNTTVQYGETASFQCKVRSDVKPHIQWLKRVEPHMKLKDLNTTIDFNGSKLIVLPAGEIMFRPDGAYLNKLVIQRATEEDAGMYICLGANTMGYNYRTAFLDVLSDPTRKRDRPGYNGTNSLQNVSVSSPNIPIPVIVGVPAGISLLVCVVMVWCCQQRRRAFSNAPAAIYIQQQQQQRMLSQQEREQFLALHQQQQVNAVVMQTSREKMYQAQSYASDTLNSNCSSSSKVQHHQHLHVHHC
ncbi:LOW QUALITY PROTEIN: fibroblast growth factor receptor-like 1 [Ptychodera flava]|uniref:receptor protein-tyrosine kinase n=1 Tax=Ptychodera flava TaxID=63121 RepID=G0Z834_PTYFL|nr:fibroblast growth factor receptor-like 1 protein [Ptychodera flava]